MCCPFVVLPVSRRHFNLLLRNRPPDLARAYLIKHSLNFRPQLLYVTLQVPDGYIPNNCSSMVTGNTTEVTICIEKGVKVHITKPQVFLIGETRIVEDGLRAYLNHIGAPDWTSDAPSDLERLIEIYGRLCYRSFKPGLNPNVTQVRTGNRIYIRNILDARHGSVIEHPRINFIFADVSRVFTHELLRHRIGLRFSDVDVFDLLTLDEALSQESLRYVRLDELGATLPTVISEDETAIDMFPNNN